MVSLWTTPRSRVLWGGARISRDLKWGCSRQTLDRTPTITHRFIAPPVILNQIFVHGSTDVPTSTGERFATPVCLATVFSGVCRVWNPLYFPNFRLISSKTGLLFAQSSGIGGAAIPVKVGWGHLLLCLVTGDTTVDRLANSKPFSAAVRGICDENGETKGRSLHLCRHCSLQLAVRRRFGELLLICLTLREREFYDADKRERWRIEGKRAFFAQEVRESPGRRTKAHVLHVETCKVALKSKRLGNCNLEFGNVLKIKDMTNGERERERVSIFRKILLCIFRWLVSKLGK